MNKAILVASGFRIFGVAPHLLYRGDLHLCKVREYRPVIKMITEDLRQKGVVTNAEKVVKLIEEMLDLKLQQYAESHMKVSPDISRLLQEKRETDRRRLEQIRAEIARHLKGA